MHHRLQLHVAMTLAAVVCWAFGHAPVMHGQEPASAAPGTRQGTTANESRREAWQRIPDIFAAMGIAPGSKVADVGAGDGFFTTRLAKAVGASGRVFAVDISQSALDKLKARVGQEGIENVEAVLGTASDPKLPEGVLDAALIVNAYHEMREHQAMLAAIKRALKPTGRLVILESVPEGRRGTPRENQENQHHLAPHFVQRDALQAGFVISRVDDPFTSRGGNMPEYLLVLTPEPAPTAATAEHVHTGPTSVADRKPDEVVAALDLKPGMTVVDLGAGTGTFTGRLARAVGPSGRTIALVIDATSVEDPKLAPASVDLVFLGHVYHHIENRVAYFTRLRAALKPGGRLAIVDFPPASGSDLPDHPDEKQVQAELAKAGFRLVRTHTFLKDQFFLEFGVSR